MNICFRGMLRPRDDETLCSWIRRVRDRDVSGRFTEAYSLLESFKDDKNYGLANENIWDLSAALNVPASRLSYFCQKPSDWMFKNAAQRLYFCPQCLLEHYTSGQGFSSLKKWDNCWLTICPTHLCLLEEAENSELEVDEAAESVFISCLSMLSEERQIGIKSILNIDPFFAYLGYRFQRYCSFCFKNEVLVTDGVSFAVPRGDIARFFDDLLSLIMRRRFVEREGKTYLSCLLQRNAWDTFNCNLLTVEPSCEALVCTNYTLHSVCARLFALAILSVLIDSPGSVQSWNKIPRIYRPWTTEPCVKYKLWKIICHSELMDYPGWLMLRYKKWHPSIQKYFSYMALT